MKSSAIVRRKSGYSTHEIRTALSDIPDSKVKRRIVLLRKRMADTVCRNLFGMTPKEAQKMIPEEIR